MYIHNMFVHVALGICGSFDVDKAGGSRKEVDRSTSSLILSLGTVFLTPFSRHASWQLVVFSVVGGSWAICDKSKRKGKKNSETELKKKNRPLNL